MLQKFKTPNRALNASIAELARVSGFGTARAVKVREILDRMVVGDLDFRWADYPLGQRKLKPLLPEFVAIVTSSLPFYQCRSSFSHTS